ncbi:MAG: hypothetical protein QM784_31040 [Polyangiaceae bacterium]
MRFRAFDFDGDTQGVVAYEAGELEFASETKYRRAEAHSLDSPTNCVTTPNRHAALPPLLFVSGARLSSLGFAGTVELRRARHTSLMPKDSRRFIAARAAVT